MKLDDAVIKDIAIKAFGCSEEELDGSEKFTASIIKTYLIMTDSVIVPKETFDKWVDVDEPSTS